MSSISDDVFFHLLIVLFWSLLLRVIIYGETSTRGLQKFLKKYRQKTRVSMFQRFTAVYLLSPEIRIPFTRRVLIIAFELGLILLSLIFFFILLSLWIPQPSVFSLFRNIAIWYNYLSIALVFLTYLHSLFTRKRL